MGRRARTLGVCNISGIIAIHNNWKAVRLIYRHHSAFSTKKRRWSKIRKKTTSLHKRSRNSWVSSKKRFEVRLRRTYSRKHQTMKRTKVLKIPPKKFEHLARSKGTLSTHEMPSTAQHELPTTTHKATRNAMKSWTAFNVDTAWDIKSARLSLLSGAGKVIMRGERRTWSELPREKMTRRSP